MPLCSIKHCHLTVLLWPARRALTWQQLWFFLFDSQQHRIVYAWLNNLSVTSHKTFSMFCVSKKISKYTSIATQRHLDIPLLSKVRTEIHLNFHFLQKIELQFQVFSYFNQAITHCQKECKSGSFLTETDLFFFCYLFFRTDINPVIVVVRSMQGNLFFSAF